MKKATKRKGAAKRTLKKAVRKPAKKLARAAGKVMSLAARKAKGLASRAKPALAKANAKKRKPAIPALAQKTNVVSITELLELKKEKAHTERTENHHTTIPPHELLDKVIHQCKPQAHTKLRSGMQGVRHK